MRIERRGIFVIFLLLVICWVSAEDDGIELSVEMCEPCVGSNPTLRRAASEGRVNNQRTVQKLWRSLYRMVIQLQREKQRYADDVFEGDTSPTQYMDIGMIPLHAPLRTTRFCNISSIFSSAYELTLDIALYMKLSRSQYSQNEALSVAWHQRDVLLSLCYLHRLSALTHGEGHVVSAPCSRELSMQWPQSRAEFAGWMFTILRESLVKCHQLVSIYSNVLEDI